MNIAPVKVQRDKRALIIHADGNLFNNPTLKCVTDLMLARGYEIDFRYPCSEAPMPEVEGLRYLPFGPHLWRLKSIIFNKLAVYPLAFFTVLLEKIFLYRRYDLIIAVDRQGLIEAAALHALTRTPYILISFEIMFASETSERIKRIEQAASRNVSLWVIQDEERAACLQAENSLDSNRLMLLPLASLGAGAQATPRLRDELKIPFHKKTAILMGSIADWAMAKDLILSVLTWPDDWVLIIHDRYGLTRQRLSGLIDKIEPLLGQKIFISNAASDAVDDMSHILAGINVGLAFYKPIYIGPYLGKNLAHLGLASGKISTCLRYGVPVITNEIGLYAKKIRDYGFGDVVATPDQLGCCLSAFNWHICGANAQNYFSRELDFGLYAEPLWQRMELARTGHRDNVKAKNH
jgi:hypothetical protein